MINYPIGVHNEGMRRDAFRTWIISRKLADEKEKDKKNLFVCNYTVAGNWFGKSVYKIGTP